MKQNLLSICILILLVFFSLAVKVLKLKSILSFIACMPHFRGLKNRQIPISTIKSVSSHLTIIDNCLIRALGVLFCAKLIGNELILKFGAMNSSDLKAHVWVENSEGEIVIGEVPHFESYTLLGAVD